MIRSKDRFVKQREIRSTVGLSSLYTSGRQPAPIMLRKSQPQREDGAKCIQKRVAPKRIKDRRILLVRLVRLPPLPDAQLDAKSAHHVTVLGEEWLGTAGRAPWPPDGNC